MTKKTTVVSMTLALAALSLASLMVPTAAAHDCTTYGASYQVGCGNCTDGEDHYHSDNQGGGCSSSASDPGSGEEHCKDRSGVDYTVCRVLYILGFEFTGELPGTINLPGNPKDIDLPSTDNLF